MAIAKQFNNLCDQHLQTVAASIEQLYQQPSKAGVQSLYVLLQSLALSAESFGIKSYETTISRICQHLLKLNDGQINKTQYESLIYLIERLQKVHKHLQAESEELQPRLCVYGLDDMSLSGLLNQIGSYKVDYRILNNFSEVEELGARDILVFRLTEQELSDTLYDEFMKAKKLPMDQVVYLAAKDNQKLRLHLAAYGVENFFICGNNTFQIKRYFQHVLPSITHQAKPYEVLLVGDSPIVANLAQSMQAFGVQTEILNSLEQALQHDLVDSLDAVVVDKDVSGIEEATFTSALRQLAPLKQLPIFYLKQQGEFLAKFSYAVLADKNYVLDKSEATDLLLLEVLSRVREERESASLLRGADDAIQEMNDWRAGLDYHNIVSIADRFGRIIEVNDTFCQISGYSRSELLGQDHRIVNSGFHEREFWVNMWKTISSGKAWKGEVCNRNKHGNLYWVESSIVPILNADGEPEKYVSIRTDITHLKGTETRLKEAQAMSSVGHWEADIITGELHWSDEIYKIFGFDKSKFSPSVEAFHSVVHPDDKDSVNESEKRAAEGGRHDVIHRIIRPNGEVRHVHELARGFFNEQGDLIRLAGTVQDVTDTVEAQKAMEESEMRLNLSQQFANIGTWDYNIQKGDLYWSERISPLFGGPEQEMETTYENFVNALHPEDRQSVLDAVNACIAEGAEYNISHRVIWEDGTVRWLHESGDVLRDDKGEPMRMLGVVQDITRRKQAEDALIQATKRAEQADKAKSEFLSSMTHELRTPLNAIIGFAQLVGMNPADDDQARQIDNILQAGNHLLTLINDILDLSAIESGEVALSIEDTKVVEVIDSSLGMIRNYAKGHGITINEANFADWQKVEVCVDFVRLKQVMINLLSNAVKYNSENGQIWVSIESRGAKVAIHIRDSGRGITEQQMKDLFVPFNRLDHQESSIEGTGIGLSICKSLIEQMDGEMLVESTVGEGSVFSVVVPRCHVECDEIVEQPQAQPELEVSKLLMVSADNSALKAVNSVVKGHDEIEFYAAPNAKAGIDSALRYQPQTVLIDIGLKDRQAVDVLHDIKNDKKLTDINSVLVVDETAQVAENLKTEFTTVINKAELTEKLMQVLKGRADD